MLRLWPEKVEAFLFPGVAWLNRKGKARSKLVGSPELQPTSFLQQLKTILDSQDPPLKAGTQITVTVSDTVANIVVMPWQPSLQSRAEIEAYAYACFQHAGITLGSDWAMEAQFRNFEMIGLAYAIPKVWLQELLSELALRKLNLVSLLPLSALIYFGVKPSAGTWPAVIQAEERFRHVTYVFGPTGMLGYDVESIIGNAEQSAQRLAGRITAQYGPCQRRSTWIAQDVSQPSSDADMLGFQHWKTIA